jgi:hypothetical protein
VSSKVSSKDCSQQKLNFDIFRTTVLYVQCAIMRLDGIVHYCTGCIKENVESD